MIENNNSQEIKKPGKFKEGDRVIFYGAFDYQNNGQLSGHVQHEGRGEVYSANCDTLLILIEDGNGTKIGVHPKQCRLLKKKERRRIFARFSSLGCLAETTMYQRLTPGDGWIEFIEVKKK